MRNSLLVILFICVTSAVFGQKDSVTNADELLGFLEKLDNKSNDFISNSNKAYNTYIEKINRKWSKKILPLSKKLNLDFADSLLDKNKLANISVKKDAYMPVMDSLNVFVDYLNLNKFETLQLDSYKTKLDSIQRILGGNENTVNAVNRELRKAVQSLGGVESFSKKDYNKFLKSLKGIEKINSGYLDKYTRNLEKLKDIGSLQNKYLSKASLQNEFKKYFETNNLIAKKFGIVKNNKGLESAKNMIKGVQDRKSLTENLPALLQESVMRNDFLKGNLAKVNEAYKKIDGALNEIVKKDSTSNQTGKEESNDSNEQSGKKFTYSIVAPLFNRVLGQATNHSTLGVMMSYRLTKKMNTGLMLEHQYKLDSKDFKFDYDYKGFSGTVFIESKFMNERKRHSIIKDIWLRSEFEVRSHHLIQPQTTDNSVNTYKRWQTNLNIGFRKKVTLLNRSFSVILMYNCNEFNNEWLSKDRLNLKMAFSL